MKKWNRCFMLMLVITLILGLCACGASDDGGQPESDYPNQPIKLIVPFAAGGGADLTARRYADVIAKNKILPQPIVVENKPGGGGVVGATELTMAKPDGYTMLFCMQGAVNVQPQLGNTTYDYTDFKPVICVANEPVVLIAKADCPANNLQELQEYAASKKDKGGLLMSFAGMGTTGHLAGMNFVQETQIPMSEVQYDGTATAVAALLGGHVDTYMSTFSDVQRFVDSGEAKFIFATERNELIPEDVQILSEEGIDCTNTGFSAFYAPKDTPQEIIDAFVEAIRTAQADQVIIDAAELLKQPVVDITGSELQEKVEDDYAVAGEVLTKLKLKK